MSKPLITLGQAKHWAGFTATKPAILVVLALNIILAFVQANIRPNWIIDHSVIVSLVLLGIVYLLGRNQKKHQVQFILGIMHSDQKHLNKLSKENPDHAQAIRLRTTRISQARKLLVDVFEKTRKN